MVERQLCKLEVRGSNPLASIFAKRKCHSVALAKADLRRVCQADIIGWTQTQSDA